MALPEGITILNDKAYFESISASATVASDDTFTLRIDHTTGADANDIIWDFTDIPEGDITSDGHVDLTDFIHLAGNWRGCLSGS